MQVDVTGDGKIDFQEFQKMLVGGEINDERASEVLLRSSVFSIEQSSPNVEKIEKLLSGIASPKVLHD